MLNLINSIWNFTILNDLKKNRYSVPFILVSLAFIFLIGLTSIEEIGAFSFLLYGLVIVYTGYVFDIKKAGLVTLICLLINPLSQYTYIVELINKQLWTKLLIERFFIIIFYYVGAMLFCKLLLQEKEAKEKYKHSMEQSLLVSKELAAANSSINELYISTIQALASAIEVKDPYTKGHSERVTNYSVAIARELKFSNEYIKLMTYAAILHDIGKIGIDEVILKKPCNLTVEEYSQIKRHPEIGGNIISSINFLQPVIPIVVHHHEYFNGHGYPNGLKGQDIPLGARILAIVDAYDAMIFDRPYRKALKMEEAMEEIKNGAGNQFDPEITKVFISILEREKKDKILAKELKII